MNVKLLICRPRGGLNDSLCEIEKCRRYAVATDRKLIVDTTRSGLHDDFWRYFENTIGAFVMPSASVDQMLVGSYQGQIQLWNYNPIEIAGCIGWFDSYTGELLSFDFNCDYAEQILLHESTWIGDFISPALMSDLQFKPEIARELKIRMPLPGIQYDAIHVRNTDYSTNFREFFEKLSTIVTDRRILVCSDDSEVFSIARHFFGNHCFRLSTFINTEKMPLHAKVSSNQFEVNLEVFTDLLALGLSENLYFSNVEQIQRASGFSLLANALNLDKKIISKLFNE